MKNHVVEIAIAFEKKTAQLRKQDDLICRDGMEQYRVGLERGTQREVPTTDGHYGKTTEVTPPANWEPSFVPPAVYQPLQEKARTEMRARLLKLIA